MALTSGSGGDAGRSGSSSSSSSLNRRRWIAITMSILESTRKVAEDSLARIINTDSTQRSGGTPHNACINSNTASNNAVSNSSSASCHAATPRRHKRIKPRSSGIASQNSAKYDKQSRTVAPYRWRESCQDSSDHFCRPECTPCTGTGNTSDNVVSGGGDFQCRRDIENGICSKLPTPSRVGGVRIITGGEGHTLPQACDDIYGANYKGTVQHRGKRAAHSSAPHTAARSSAPHTAAHSSAPHAAAHSSAVLSAAEELSTWHGCVPPRIHSPEDSSGGDAILLKDKIFGNYYNDTHDDMSENVCLPVRCTGGGITDKKSENRQILSVEQSRTVPLGTGTCTCHTIGSMDVETHGDVPVDDIELYASSGILWYTDNSLEDDIVVSAAHGSACESIGSTEATMSQIGSPRSSGDFELLSSRSSSSYSLEISDPETPVHTSKLMRSALNTTSNNTSAIAYNALAPLSPTPYKRNKLHMMDVNAADLLPAYEPLYVAEYPVVASALSVMINMPLQEGVTLNALGNDNEGVSHSQETATFRESHLNPSPPVDDEDDEDSSLLVETTEHPALRYIIAWRAALTQAGSYLYPKSVFEDVYTGGDLMREFQAFAVLIWRFEAELASEHKKEIRVAFQRMRVEAEVVSHIEDLLSRNIVDEKPLEHACARARETEIANTSLDLLQFRLCQIQTEKKALDDLNAAEGNYDAMNSLLLDLDKVLTRAIISPTLLRVLDSLLQESRETNARIAFPRELASVIEFSSVTGLHGSKAIVAALAPRFSFSGHNTDDRHSTYEDCPTTDDDHQARPYGGGGKMHKAHSSDNDGWSSEGSFEDPVGYGRAKSRRVFNDAFCVGYITTEGYFTAVRSTDMSADSMLKRQRTSKAFWASRLSMGSNLEKMTTGGLNNSPFVRGDSNFHKAVSRAMKQKYPSKKKGLDPLALQESTGTFNNACCHCCSCCKTAVPTEEVAEVLVA